MKISAGTEGKLINIATKINNEIKKTQETKFGGFAQEGDKVGAKVGRLSVSLCLKESETKLSIGDQYIGAKVQHFESKEFYIGSKRTSDNLTVDVRSSYKIGNDPKSALHLLR